MKKGTPIKIQNIPTNKRVGLLVLSGRRILHSHETAIITKLLRFGYNIVCLAETHFPHTKTADIVWQNELWEIKSITGDSRYTVMHSIQEAKKQSRNIVLDTYQSNISIERIIGRVQEGLLRNRTIKTILVVDRKHYCIINRGEL